MEPCKLYLSDSNYEGVVAVVEDIENLVKKLIEADKLEDLIKSLKSQISMDESLLFLLKNNFINAYDGKTMKISSKKEIEALLCTVDANKKALSKIMEISGLSKKKVKKNKTNL